MNVVKIPSTGVPLRTTVQKYVSVLAPFAARVGGMATVRMRNREHRFGGSHRHRRKTSSDSGTKPTGDDLKVTSFNVSELW